MTGRVLISGKRAFAAQGLKQLLEKSGWAVEEASALGELPDGRFDAIVNFGLPREGGVEAAIEDVRRLAEFAALRGARRFIQISSLSVYDFSLTEVDASTPIDESPFKGPYSARKVAQDKFLESLKRPFEVTFIRPGVVVAEDGSTRTGGIWMRLFGRFGILLGSSSTPLVEAGRGELHEAIADELSRATPSKTVLVGRNTTKAEFAKRRFGAHALPLPRAITCAMARLLLPKGRAMQVRGLFFRPRLVADS